MSNKQILISYYEYIQLNYLKTVLKCIYEIKQFDCPHAHEIIENIMLKEFFDGDINVIQLINHFELIKESAFYIINTLSPVLTKQLRDTINELIRLYGLLRNEQDLRQYKKEKKVIKPHNNQVVNSSH